MKVLALVDDCWHPARIPQAGLQPITQQGFDIDWILDAQDWTAERMAAYPLVILTKSNNRTSTDQSSWMTDDVQAAFVRYIQHGGGLTVIHSGSAGYQQCQELRRLMGGVFLQHPPQCEVNWRAQGSHSLAQTVSEFRLRDEHYFMALDASDADVFMVSASQYGEQPAGWVRAEGKGRVCVLTPGHNLDVWLHPVYQNLLVSALNWCGGHQATGVL